MFDNMVTGSVLSYVNGYTGGNLDNVPKHADLTLKFLVETVKVELKYAGLTLEEAIEIKRPKT